MSDEYDEYDEYIKKDDAIKTVNDMPYDTFFVEADRMWLIAEIDKLPSADVVEREIVEWKYHETCVADESKLLQELYAKMIQKTDSSLTTHQLVYWGDVKDVIEKFFLIKRSSNLFRLRGDDDE